MLGFGETVTGERECSDAEYNVAPCEWRTLGVADPGSGRSWEWWTLGVADPGIKLDRYIGNTHHRADCGTIGTMGTIGK